MATTSKRPLGFGIFGFAFAMTGLIFVFAGQGVLGLTLAAVGLGLFVIAVFAARKPASGAVEGHPTSPAEHVRARS
jgi:hypothetical protein